MTRVSSIDGGTPTEVQATTPTQGRLSEAIVFDGVEIGLNLRSVFARAPHAAEVMLEVAGCGACHSDVHKLEGHGTVATPCIIGHEISGTIVELGTDVHDLAVGDRVVCSFLAPCGRCASCSAGREDDCPVFRARMQVEGVALDGSIRYLEADGSALRASGIGGLSRFVTLPATAVFALPQSWPETIPLTDAAILGCAGFTAYGAIKRAARLQPGETVAVIAAGGVGACVVALARHFGAKQVIAIDVRDDSLELAGRLGATDVLRSDEADFAQRLSEVTGDRGVDVVFDTIGLPATFLQAMALASVGGRVVVTGLAGAGSSYTIPDPNQFVRRKLSVIGSYAARPREDMPELLDLVARGAMDPSRLISKRFSFDHAEAAFDAVARGTISGRALIEF